MDLSDEERVTQAMAAIEAGRPAEHYRLFLPLAEAGHPEAMAAVGSLLHLGAHRLETFESPMGDPADDPDAHAAEQALGLRYLQAASDAGVGAASFNLAGAVAWDGRFGTWEERKARSAALFALADAQGFTPFGHLMGRDGQPYLDAIERYAASGDALSPGTLASPDG